VQFFFETLRNAFGDLQFPEFSTWSDAINNDKGAWEEASEAGNKVQVEIYSTKVMLSETMMGLGILIWLAQTALAFVVLMNFLVAIVSDAYADIMDKREQVDYNIKV
jgi:uncharacterized membrane protein YphA (DoxX/SURF4 family)